MNAKTAMILTLTLTLAASSHAIPPTNDGKPEQPATELATAVATFNTQAKQNDIGKTQPPLTVDEVVASIRGIDRENHPRMPDSVFWNLQDIAETQKLPRGSGFSFISQWSGYRGFDFDVWWIDLSVLDGDDSRFIFRMRKRMIASRKMQASDDPAVLEMKAIRQAAGQFMSRLTPEERERIENGDLELLEQKTKQLGIQVD